MAYLASNKSTRAHTRDTTQRIDDVGGEVVADVAGAHPAVLGDEADGHQEAAAGLADADALQLHDLRQQRRRLLQPVLHLDLRDVRIGAAREGQVIDTLPLLSLVEVM